jgi:hypothetical protein
MKIAMYDLEGHLLEVFEVDTVRDLEKQLNIPQGNLNGCLSNKLNSTNNRQFKSVHGNKPLIKIGNILNALKGTKNIHVHKYYKGTYVCTYESVKEASEKNYCLDENISSCCRGNRKLAGGFEWKYAN